MKGRESAGSRSIILGGTVFVLLSFAGCKSVASSRAARKEGERLLGAKEYSRAEAAFQKAAALSTEPEERAAALLGSGQACLEAGDPKAALELFKETREMKVEANLLHQTNRLIGLAYFAQEEWTLAERYLSKALPGAQRGERELTLARLVISSRRLGQMADVARYRSLLSRPMSHEVEETLAEKDPLITAARTRRSSIAEEETPPPPQVRPRRESPPAPRSGAEQEQSRLLVLPRSNWSPSPMRRNIEPMEAIDKITIHHTGGDACWDTSPSDVASLIRKIQRYHQGELRWADIGYHYIIDRNGSIWQGRPLGYQGAHAQGAKNRGNIGIVLLGNFYKQELSPAQRESLVAFVSKLSDHFGIPPSRIYTHQEILLGKTACPGPALSRYVGEIREDLRRRAIALGK